MPTSNGSGSPHPTRSRWFAFLIILLFFQGVWFFGSRTTSTTVATPSVTDAKGEVSQSANPFDESGRGDDAVVVETQGSTARRNTQRHDLKSLSPPPAAGAGQHQQPYEGVRATTRSDVTEVKEKTQEIGLNDDVRSLILREVASVIIGDGAKTEKRNGIDSLAVRTPKTATAAGGLGDSDNNSMNTNDQNAEKVPNRLQEDRRGDEGAAPASQQKKGAASPLAQTSTPLSLSSPSSMKVVIGRKSFDELWNDIVRQEGQRQRAHAEERVKQQRERESKQLKKDGADQNNEKRLDDRVERHQTAKSASLGKEPVFIRRFRRLYNSASSPSELNPTDARTPTTPEAINAFATSLSHLPHRLVCDVSPANGAAAAAAGDRSEHIASFVPFLLPSSLRSSSSASTATDEYPPFMFGCGLGRYTVRRKQPLVIDGSSSSSSSTPTPAPTPSLITPFSLHIITRLCVDYDVLRADNDIDALIATGEGGGGGALQGGPTSLWNCPFTSLDRQHNGSSPSSASSAAAIPLSVFPPPTRPFLLREGFVFYARGDGAEMGLLDGAAVVDDNYRTDASSSPTIRPIPFLNTDSRFGTIQVSVKPETGSTVRYSVSPFNRGVPYNVEQLRGEGEGEEGDGPSFTSSSSSSSSTRRLSPSVIHVTYYHNKYFHLNLGHTLFRVIDMLRVGRELWRAGLVDDGGGGGSSRGSRGAGRAQHRARLVALLLAEQSHLGFGRFMVPLLKASRMFDGNGGGVIIVPNGLVTSPPLPLSSDAARSTRVATSSASPSSTSHTFDYELYYDEAIGGMVNRTALLLLKDEGEAEGGGGDGGRRARQKSRGGGCPSHALRYPSARFGVSASLLSSRSSKRRRVDKAPPLSFPRQVVQNLKCFDNCVTSGGGGSQPLFARRLNLPPLFQEQQASSSSSSRSQSEHESSHGPIPFPTAAEESKALVNTIIEFGNDMISKWRLAEKCAAFFPPDVRWVGGGGGGGTGGGNDIRRPLRILIVNRRLSRRIVNAEVLVQHLETIVGAYLSAFIATSSSSQPFLPTSVSVQLVELEAFGDALAPQASLFYCADIVLAVHGAAIAWSLAMRPKSFEETFPIRDMGGAEDSRANGGDDGGGGHAKGPFSSHGSKEGSSTTAVPFAPPSLIEMLPYGWVGKVESESAVPVYEVLTDSVVRGPQRHEEGDGEEEEEGGTDDAHLLSSHHYRYPRSRPPYLFHQRTSLGSGAQQRQHHSHPLYEQQRQQHQIAQSNRFASRQYNPRNPPPPPLSPLTEAGGDGDSSSGETLGQAIHKQKRRADPFNAPFEIEADDLQLLGVIVLQHVKRIMLLGQKQGVV